MEEEFEEPKPTSEVDVWLFGKPEWEINLEEASPEDIEELGKELKERLKRVAEIIRKLEENGWERGGGLYDIHFWKEISKEEAEKEIEQIGLGDEVEVREVPY